MATKSRKIDAVEMSRGLREKTGRLLARMGRGGRLKFLNRHLEKFRVEPPVSSLATR